MSPKWTCSSSKETPSVVTDSGWTDTLSNKASDSPALAQMKSDVQRFMSQWNIRGMQIAVSRNDSLLFAMGYGWADMERGEKMEANSIMRIASASKLLTATAIIKLAEEGKLSLDKHVFGDDGILNNTGFTEAIKDKRMFDITVRDLLLHKGGFTLGAGDPMFNTAEIIKAKKLNHAPDNDELIMIVANRRLGFQPGASRKYSNFGYMLLSKVIEKISGQNYWEYVQTNVLSPAGIFGMRPATNYYAEKHPGEVKYYSPDNELVEEFNGSGKMVDRCYGGANINGLVGAGGWVSSAADLNRLVTAIDGHPGLKDILSPQSVALMTARNGEEKLCLGWTDSDGKGRWHRSGTLSSAHSLIERFPDGECWVITMNTGVWRGFHFTRQMQRLVENCRAKYSNSLPRQNLFI